MRILITVMLLFWGSSLMASELLDIINQERAKRGLTQLLEKSPLTCAATKHSKDIGARKACTHTGREEEKK